LTAAESSVAIAFHIGAAGGRCNRPTEICVPFTAADAHMRDYRIGVPADAVAAADEKRDARAMAVIAQAMPKRVRRRNCPSSAGWSTFPTDARSAAPAQRLVAAAWLISAS